MGRKNKRKGNYNNSPERDDTFISKMMEVFNKIANGESVNSNINQQTEPKQNSTMMESGSSGLNTNTDEIRLDNVRRRELEMKDKEIELLKLQNELLKGNQVPTAGACISFRDVEESLSKFSGEDDYKIEKWMQDVNDAAVCMKWSTKQKVIYSKRLLTGTAKDSLRLAVTDTWENLTALCNSEFCCDT